ncbi:MAG TPA: protein tyrosine phosphatase family protein [Roseiflexaceae bacterium]|nr:protein tyrosine phosphatase family protein [Roseiflexaceae bacterium]
MADHCTNEIELAAERRGGLIRYEIDERLTLAGQPQPEDWALLAAEGFPVVINMRGDPTRAVLQQRNAETAGLRYIHLPLPAYELQAEHLATFHALMQAQPGRVFLHCRTATRVALMWLLERTVYDGWSQERAEATLRAAGYDEDALETFAFCAADYFEREGAPRLV